jgi:hypothetical protein
MPDYTALRVIKNAYENAGLLQEGATPSTTQQSNGLIRLTDLLNFEQTQGLKLWLWQDITVTLVAGQGLYPLRSAGGDPNDGDLTRVYSQVIDGYYRDSNGIQRPLANPAGLSWNEWVRLSQPAVQGQVNSYFVDKQQGQLNLHLWNVPDTLAATGTVHVICRTQQTTPVHAADNILLPPEWFIYACWALASELCIGQHPEIVNRCDAKAQYYRQALEAWDTEDATLQFQPDSRGGYVQGDFR